MARKYQSKILLRKMLRRESDAVALQIKRLVFISGMEWDSWSINIQWEGSGKEREAPWDGRYDVGFGDPTPRERRFFS
jgi:hypothetical protein